MISKNLSFIYLVNTQDLTWKVRADLPQDTSWEEATLIQFPTRHCTRTILYSLYCVSINNATRGEGGASRILRGKLNSVMTESRVRWQGQFIGAFCERMICGNSSLLFPVFYAKYIIPLNLLRVFRTTSYWISYWSFPLINVLYSMEFLKDYLSTIQTVCIRLRNLFWCEIVVCLINVIQYNYFYCIVLSENWSIFLNGHNYNYY